MSNDTVNTTTSVQFIALREQFELERMVEHYGGWYYRPRLREGEVRVGYVCLRSDTPPTKDELKGLSAAPIVVGIDTDLVKEDLLLKKPQKWQKLFPTGEPRNGDLCVYRPILTGHDKDDYVALSDCAFRYGPGFDENDPDPDFRCVHRALLGKSELVSPALWKDRESTWNIQGSAFFMWNDGEEFPSSAKAHVLNDGTLFSNILPESFGVKPPETLSWQPIQFYQTNYDNSTSDQTAEFTFEGTLMTETSVTGTWQRDDGVEIANTFRAAVEYLTEINVGPLVKITERAELGWENTIRTTSTTAIGGGTTKVSSGAHRQSCTVAIPPRQDLRITATFFRGNYDLSFTGQLRFASKVRGAPALMIPINGKFAVSVDTLQTWWEVGDGTFVSKTLPQPI